MKLWEMMSLMINKRLAYLKNDWLGRVFLLLIVIYSISQIILQVNNGGYVSRGFVTTLEDNPASYWTRLIKYSAFAGVALYFSLKKHLRKSKSE